MRWSLSFLNSPFQTSEHDDANFQGVSTALPEGEEIFHRKFNFKLLCSASHRLLCFRGENWKKILYDKFLLKVKSHLCFLCASFVGSRAEVINHYTKLALFEFIRRINGFLWFLVTNFERVLKCPGDKEVCKQE